MSDEKEQSLIEAQISYITSLRVNEHQTWITVFSACLATSGLLLIAIFQGGSTPDPTQGIVICIFGFLVSAVHLRIQGRAQKTMVAHETALNELLSKYSLVNPKNYIIAAKCLGAREVMKIFTWFQFFCWFAGIILFLCNYNT